jgi:hypothetical protein
MAFESAVAGAGGHRERQLKEGVDAFFSVASE